MAARERKKLLGRPPVEIDPKALQALRSVHCTEIEIADYFGISKRQLIRRIKEPELAEVWSRGVSSGKVALRRLRWRQAQMQNSAGVTMSIFLSGQWLGETQKSAIEMSGRVDSAIEVSSARERITRKLDTLAERIQSRVAGLAAQVGAGAAVERTE